MRLCRAVPVAVAICAIAGAARAEPATIGLEAGSYEVRVQIEIPNVNSWAWSTTRRVCLSGETTGGDLPIPALSPNNPFATCHASGIERRGAILDYGIVCDGRGAARAHATYTLLPDGFKGQIAMVLGAKNMTMRELQVGRRLGACDLVAARD